MPKVFGFLICLTVLFIIGNLMVEADESETVKSNKTQYEAEIVEYVVNGVRIHRPGYRVSEYDLVTLKVLKPQDQEGLQIEVGIEYEKSKKLWRDAKGTVKFTAKLEKVKKAASAESSLKLFEGSLSDIKFQSGDLKKGDSQ